MSLCALDIGFVAKPTDEFRRRAAVAANIWAATATVLALGWQGKADLPPAAVCGATPPPAFLQFLVLLLLLPFVSLLAMPFLLLTRGGARGTEEAQVSRDEPISFAALVSTPPAREYKPR